MEVSELEETLPRGDVFLTVTGRPAVLREEHFELLKDGAILANAGHFSSEIDVRALRTLARETRPAGDSIEEFALAVQNLIEGPSFVTTQIVRALVVAAVGATAGSERLTSRETDVLRLLAEGYSNGEIAEHLQVSPNTVRSHVQALLSKLEVNTRAKVVARARALGLLG